MSLEAAVVWTLGAVYVVAGFGMLFNPSHYAALLSAWSAQRALGLLMGLLLLALGLSLCLALEWRADAVSVLACVIALLCASKGALFLLAPRQMARIAEGMAVNFRLYGVVVVLVGIALSGVGWLS